MKIEKYTKKFMASEKLTLEELEELLTFNKVKYTVDVDGKVIIHGKLVFPVALNYFPFPQIKEVQGDLIVSSMRLRDDLSVLPPKVLGDFIFSRSILVAPYNFPAITGSVDLSSSPKLMDISEFRQEEIDGDLILDNCNFSNLKNEYIKEIYGALSAANNKLSSVSISANIRKSVNLSDNLLTHTPNLKSDSIHVTGNPIEPSDEFDQARW